MDVNDQLITMIHQQLAQQKEQHQQQMEMLQKQMETERRESKERMEAERRESKEQMKELIEKLSNRKPDTKEALFDRLRQRIEKFTYDPEEGRFFDLWLKRFEDTIQGHCHCLPCWNDVNTRKKKATRNSNNNFNKTQLKTRNQI